MHRKKLLMDLFLEPALSHKTQGNIKINNLQDAVKNAKHHQSLLYNHEDI